jgi:hypothetical protein
MGMPPKVVTRLEQGELRPALQGVGDSQTGDAGADNGNSHGKHPTAGQNIWISIFVVDKVSLFGFLSDKIQINTCFVLDKMET